MIFNNGFNIDIYREYNDDLCNLSDNELIYHFNNFGKYENRIYKNTLPNDFIPLIYKSINNDLKNLNDKELKMHYMHNGIKENRKYKNDIIFNNIKNDKIDISIVMAYHNRKIQLINTLNNFEKQYSNKYNFEVIIVDDNSNDENKLEDIINNYSFNIIYYYITIYEKNDNINPCIVYNKGFTLSKGNIIIIQNPECYHYTNILELIDDLNLLDNYYTSPVISTPTFKHTNDVINNNYLNEELINYLEKENMNYEYHYCKGWYNHPIYNNRHLHFCSIISRHNLDILMGFDETYSKNLWYDDDEFIFRIKMFLEVKYLNSIVIHQYHLSGSSENINNESKKNNIEFNKNKFLLLKNENENYNLNWLNYNNININDIFYKCIDKKIGIAVSIYSDLNTKHERIEASKLCLKSIATKLKNFLIIFVIDYYIQPYHLDIIKDLCLYNKNIEVYINTQNFGIAKTKNICLKILENKKIDYICLLDDDIEILDDFSQSIFDTFNNTNIPIITNINYSNNYDTIKSINNINFINYEKYTNLYGNFLAINSKFIKKYGYFYIFPEKWGAEHLEYTIRLLRNTIFNSYTINLNIFFKNEQIINNINTLHLHSSTYIDYTKAYNNANIMDELLSKNIDYIDFDYNINDINKII